MSIDKFYDSIDSILHSMMEYHGINEDEDEYFDDFSNEDDDFSDEDDFFDASVCTKSDIELCGQILEKYIDDILSASRDGADDDEILKIVSKAVKKLNKINEKCDYELIESNHSDEICELIHDAAVEAGLVDVPDNVTDEWRNF